MEHNFKSQISETECSIQINNEKQYAIYKYGTKNLYFSFQTKNKAEKMNRKGSSDKLVWIKKQWTQNQQETEKIPNLILINTSPGAECIYKHLHLAWIYMHILQLYKIINKHKHTGNTLTPK